MFTMAYTKSPCLSVRELEVIRYLISAGSRSLEWEASHGYHPMSLLERKTQTKLITDLHNARLKRKLQNTQDYKDAEDNQTPWEAIMAQVDEDARQGLRYKQWPTAHLAHRNAPTDIIRMSTANAADMGETGSNKPPSWTRKFRGRWTRAEVAQQKRERESISRTDPLQSQSHGSFGGLSHQKRGHPGVSMALTGRKTHMSKVVKEEPTADESKRSFRTRRPGIPFSRTARFKAIEEELDERPIIDERQELGKDAFHAHMIRRPSTPPHDDKRHGVAPRIPAPPPLFGSDGFHAMISHVPRVLDEKVVGFSAKGSELGPPNTARTSKSARPKRVLRERPQTARERSDARSEWQKKHAVRMERARVRNVEQEEKRTQSIIEKSTQRQEDVKMQEQRERFAILQRCWLVACAGANAVSSLQAALVKDRREKTRLKLLGAQHPVTAAKKIQKLVRTQEWYIRKHRERYRWAASKLSQYAVRFETNKLKRKSTGFVKLVTNYVEYDGWAEPGVRGDLKVPEIDVTTGETRMRVMKGAGEMPEAKIMSSRKDIKKAVILERTLKAWVYRWKALGDYYVKRMESIYKDADIIAQAKKTSLVAAWPKNVISLAKTMDVGEYKDQRKYSYSALTRMVRIWEGTSSEEKLVAAYDLVRLHNYNLTMSLRETAPGALHFIDKILDRYKQEANQTERDIEKRNRTAAWKTTSRRLGNKEVLANMMKITATLAKKQDEERANEAAPMRSRVISALTGRTDNARFDELSTSR